MSVIGTGVAAGVAQTSQQTEQVARQRDRQRTQTTSDAKRLQDQSTAHLRAVEEGDETETPAQLRIDGQVPQRDSGQPTPEQPDHHQSPEQQPAEIAVEDLAQPQSPASPAGHANRLYQHLDIQA